MWRYIETGRRGWAAGRRKTGITVLSVGLAFICLSVGRAAAGGLVVSCVGQPPGTPCTDYDGSPCTCARCDGLGACIDPTPGLFCGGDCTSIWDGNECTLPFCNTSGQCGTPKAVDTPCTDHDGNICTIASCDGFGNCHDDCEGGYCNFRGGPCTDWDGNECTEPFCNTSGQCGTPKAVDTPCTDHDGNICTIASCDGFGNCHDDCEGGYCNFRGGPCTDWDGNECTEPFCNTSGQCARPKAFGTFCNVRECAANTCNGSGDCDTSGTTFFGGPCTDTDGEDCTEAACGNDISNLGTCVQEAVVHSDDTPCDDGDECTTNNTCQGGSCDPGAPVICIALDQCHDPGVCDPATGICSDPPSPDGTLCYDGDDCTEPDTCQSGICVPGQQGCRVSTSKKGSLLTFSKIELKWNASGALTQDTFVAIVNDYTEDVFVQWYFINGDAPLGAVFNGGLLVERAHRGWNWADCMTELTHNESTYMSMARGTPLGCQPFTILDPGTPPGRPDPEGAPGDRILRGYAIAFAVDQNGEAISWNHLSGSVDIVNYADRSAWEFNGFAAQCVAEPIPGLPCCISDVVAEGRKRPCADGELQLNGLQYDFAFGTLLFDFYAVGSQAFTLGLNTVTLDTDLTLYPVDVDLRQDNEGPVTTKAKIDIWNQNEDGFSGSIHCITCWDQTLLSNYAATNNFLIDNLHTDKGKARIDGVASNDCDPAGSCCDLASDLDCFPSANHPAIDRVCSKPAALLGVSNKLLFFNGPGVQGRQSDAGMNLVGQGIQSAVIQWDIITPPQPLTTDGEEQVVPEKVGVEASTNAIKTLSNGERPTAGSETAPIALNPKRIQF